MCAVLFIYFAIFQYETDQYLIYTYNYIIISVNYLFSLEPAKRLF